MQVSYYRNPRRIRNGGERRNKKLRSSDGEVWATGSLGLYLVGHVGEETKYSQKLLDMILEGKIDTTFLISHWLPLADGPDGYRGFKEKQDEFTKLILKPH